jgi:hypothetical protein
MRKPQRPFDSKKPQNHAAILAFVRKIITGAHQYP